MRRSFLGLAIALVAAGLAAADDAAVAVVKKAITAHGGADALNKYTAHRANMKGEIPVMGNNVEFTGDITSAPGKLKMNINLEVMGMKIAVSQVVNGDKFKRTVKVGDMNVDSGQDNKDEIKVGLATQDAEQLTPLLDAKKFTIKSGGEEDVDGKKASVVIATPKSIDRELKLYFDKESGMLVKEAHRGVAQNDSGGEAEVFQERYFSDFKKINGVQIPMKLVQHHDGKKFMTATVSDYELLEKIDDSEFKVDN